MKQELSFNQTENTSYFSDFLMRRSKVIGKAILVLVGITTGAGLILLLFFDIPVSIIGLLGAILLFELGAYWLHRRGFPDRALILLLLIASAVLTLLAVYLGGIYSPVVAAFPLMVFGAISINRKVGRSFLWLGIAVQTGLLLAGQLDLLPQAMFAEITWLPWLIHLYLILQWFAAMGLMMEGYVIEIEATQKLSRRYQALFNSSNDAVFLIGFNFEIIEVNKKGADLLGYRAEEMRGKNLRHILVVEDMRKDFHTFHELIEGKNQPILSKQLKHKDGTLVDVELNVLLVSDEQGRPLYVQSIARDVTEKRRIEMELREYRQRYQALFEHSEEAVFIISLDLVNLAANDSAYTLLGYQPPELIGKPVSALLAPTEDFANTQGVLESLLARQNVPKYERRLVKKDGGLLAAEVSSAMVYDPQGNPLYIQSIVRDITDQRKTEEHLKSQLTEMVTLAATDPLTGLHNRRTMRNYAENLLRQAWIRKEPFSLVLIDLDDLKAINDRHGHESGDFALLHLSKTLVKNMRSSDLSGRWAGDEFLLLLPGAGIDSAAATAERLLVKINQDPIKLEGGEEFRVEICMGVAGTESRAEGVYDLDKMVNMADKAMYSAKQAGGNQVKLYVE